MNRVSSSKLLLAAAGATFLAAAAHSATTADVPPPAPPKEQWHGRNLQVLAPNMPREQVIGVMKKSSEALGVPCTYCHVEEGEKMNFVADVKREKEMARWMMRASSSLRSSCSSATRRISAARSATDDVFDHSRCAASAAAIACLICSSVAVGYSLTNSPVDGSTTAYIDVLIDSSLLEDRAGYTHRNSCAPPV